MTAMRRGDPGLSGASVTTSGINFTLRAPHAERVELCLFTPDGEQRVDLPAAGSGLFCGLTDEAGPGSEYGYRVHGRWEPASGVFTNPAKLLLDPYARQVRGGLHPDPSLVTHRARSGDEPDGRDSAPFVPRSVVNATEFHWDDDEPPGTAWENSLIYETHVRGLTMRHPAVPLELRGTYVGVASPPIIEHLMALRVTALELLPVHYSVAEPSLARRGLTNYWGYSTIGWFAPNPVYSAGPDPIAEFKEMVKTLHQAGIEVILDVVYNHTAEGNHLGPTLCYRGLDNPGFYRLDPADPRRYTDVTGTGNTVDQSRPWALQLSIDSLRYWATEMHVDGFRFDLAVALGRAPAAEAPFFQAVAADPILSKLKLIAEPWDLGPDGYQLGRFPAGWREWNGKFRDDVRDFWRNADGMVNGFARRFAGSSDIFGERGSTASINFITAHDGFTLSDLVSYNHKHNDANQEHNRDGESHNRSWNSGAEGPTLDPAIVARRKTRAHTFLATLILARGVPMLLGGDELGRTQAGNNNAYCQDNAVSWLDWEAMDWERITFTQKLAELRHRHPVLRRQPEVIWLGPDGDEMDRTDWELSQAHTLAAFLDGSVCDPPDSSFLFFFNSRPDPQGFTLPDHLQGQAWSLVVDTADTVAEIGATVEVGPFGLVVARSTA